MYLDITEDELQEIYEEILTILGAYSVNVDVTKREVLIVLKRAFQEFEKETAIWQLKNQFGNVYGLPSGLLLSNQIATFNMNLVTQITDWFASMQRLGGKIPWKKDYIVLEPGRQIYDLSLESSKPYPAGSRRIHRVLWASTPEFFDGYHFNGRLDNIQGDDILYSSAWNFTNAGLNYGSNPLSFLGYGFDTILMLQSIETRRKVLFSEFFHNLSGDMLELLPMPGSRSLSIRPGTRVFYYYFDEKEVIAASKQIDDTVNSQVSSELQVSPGTGVIDGNTSVLIANPLQMKIDIVPWSMLSPWGKTWIWEFTLARCKYIQGSKWRKIKKTFSTGEMEYEIEFDYQSLLSEAADEINSLREQLRNDLGQLNLAQLYQDKAAMVDAAIDINRRQPRLWFISGLIPPLLTLINLIRF